MKNMMEYKDYFAHIEYSDEDNCFYGTIAGIADIISFEGNNTKELKKPLLRRWKIIFTCAKNGKEPAKSL